MALCRPQFVLFGVLLNMSGIALATHLGHEIDPLAALLVLASTSSLQLGVVILSEHSDYLEAKKNFASTFFAINSGLIAAGKVEPEHARTAGALFVLTSAALAAVMVIGEFGNADAVVVILVTIALSMSYSVNPPRVARYWFGDLVVATVVGFMIPAAAFSAQAGLSYESLWISIPSFIQMVALLVMIDFTDAEVAAASNRRNLVVVLGRGRAWWLLNAVVLLGMVLSAATYGLGNHILTSATMAMAFGEEVVFMQVFRTRGVTQKTYAWLAGLGAAFLTILEASIILTLMAL